MKKKHVLKRVTATLIAAATTVLMSTQICADHYVGYVDIHGDPSLGEVRTLSPRGPSDVARYYPTGSYYSMNHLACQCHGSSNCPSESCNCGRYYYYCNGYDNSAGIGVSLQCAAFAKFCYNEYNGYDVPHHPDGETNQNFVQLSTATLYSKLKQFGGASYVRGKTSSGARHSIFIVSYTSSTVTIWHSNYFGKCMVKNETVSYSEFIKRMSKVDWYYTSNGDYYDL